MKVMIEIDLPDGQQIPRAEDIKRLTDPDWHAEWWHIEDIQSQEEDLSEDEARRVLEIMAHKADCNIGINWDSIGVWADWVRDERPEHLSIQVSENHYPEGKDLFFIYDEETNGAFDEMFFDTEEEAKAYLKRMDEV